METTISLDTEVIDQSTEPVAPEPNISGNNVEILGNFYKLDQLINAYEDTLRAASENLANYQPDDSTIKRIAELLARNTSPFFYAAKLQVAEGALAHLESTLDSPEIASSRIGRFIFSTCESKMLDLLEAYRGNIKNIALDTIRREIDRYITCNEQTIRACYAPAILAMRDHIEAPIRQIIQEEIKRCMPAGAEQPQAEVPNPNKPSF